MSKRRPVKWVGRWAYRSVKRGAWFRAQVANRDIGFSARHWRWQTMGDAYSSEANADWNAEAFAREFHGQDVRVSARAT